jgi:hypothetical protein
VVERRRDSGQSAHKTAAPVIRAKATHSMSTSLCPRPP